jgi:hypothetical protein
MEPPFAFPNFPAVELAEARELHELRHGELPNRREDFKLVL